MKFRPVYVPLLIAVAGLALALLDVTVVGYALFGVGAFLAACLSGLRGPQTGSVLNRGGNNEEGAIHLPGSSNTGEGGSGE